MDRPLVGVTLLLLAPVVAALLFGGLLILAGSFRPDSWIGRAAKGLLRWLPRGAAYVAMLWAFWGIWTVDEHDLRLFCTVCGFILAGWMLRLRAQRAHYRHLAELYRRQAAGEAVDEELSNAVWRGRHDDLGSD